MGRLDCDRRPDVGSNRLRHINVQLEIWVVCLLAMLLLVLCVVHLTILSMIIGRKAGRSMMADSVLLSVSTSSDRRCIPFSHVVAYRPPVPLRGLHSSESAGLPAKSFTVRSNTPRSARSQPWSTENRLSAHAVDRQCRQTDGRPGHVRRGRQHRIADMLVSTNTNRLPIRPR